MLIGTHRMRMKVRHMKPKYPMLGIVEWIFDFVVSASVFLMVFGIVYFLLMTFAGSS